MQKLVRYYEFMAQRYTETDEGAFNPYTEIVTNLKRVVYDTSTYMQTMRWLAHMAVTTDMNRNYYLKALALLVCAWNGDVEYIPDTGSETQDVT